MDASRIRVLSLPQIWHRHHGRSGSDALGDDFEKLQEKMQGKRTTSIKFGIGIRPDDDITPIGDEYHTHPRGQNRIEGLDEHHIDRSCVIHYRTFAGI